MPSLDFTPKYKIANISGYKIEIKNTFVFLNSSSRREVMIENILDNNRFTFFPRDNLCILWCILFQLLYLPRSRPLLQSNRSLQIAQSIIFHFYKIYAFSSEKMIICIKNMYLSITSRLEIVICENVKIKNTKVKKRLFRQNFSGF